jgi:hypothetical protein
MDVQPDGPTSSRCGSATFETRGRRWNSPTSFGAILDEADRAWLEKDRDRAADLYETASPALDEVRRRRLAFVRGRQTSG